MDLRNKGWMYKRPTPSAMTSGRPRRQDQVNPRIRAPRKMCIVIVIDVQGPQLGYLLLYVLRGWIDRPASIKFS